MSTPPNQPSNLQNNAPAPKKRSGLAWFFGGVGLAVLLCLLLCCGGVVGGIGFVYHQINAAKQFKANMETAQPVKFTGTKLKQAEVDAAWNRCVDAMDTVRAGKPAKLTLSDVELNNLHEERVADNTAELPGMDITARKDGISGRVSVPDPEKPGYLTMDIDLDLKIVNSQLTFNIVSLKDPKGETAPFAVRKVAESLLRDGMLYGEGHKAPPNAAADVIQPTSPLYGLKSLSFDTGKIEIEVDPERVKEHNRALNKPEDTPLFEGN